MNTAELHRAALAWSILRSNLTVAKDARNNIPHDVLLLLSLRNFAQNRPSKRMLVMGERIYRRQGAPALRRYLQTFMDRNMCNIWNQVPEDYAIDLPREWCGEEPEDANDPWIQKCYEMLCWWNADGHDAESWLFEIAGELRDSMLLTRSKVWHAVAALISYMHHTTDALLLNYSTGGIEYDIHYNSYSNNNDPTEPLELPWSPENLRTTIHDNRDASREIEKIRYGYQIVDTSPIVQRIIRKNARRAYRNEHLAKGKPKIELRWPNVRFP